MTPRNIVTGLLLAILCLSAGCSGGTGDNAALQGNSLRDANTPPANLDVLHNALPSLEQVAAELDGRRQGSFTPAEGHRDGSDFDAGLINSNVSASPPQCIFTPDYVPPKSGLDGLAVAIYTFLLPDYALEPVQFSQSWSSRPAQGDTYLALGNWDSMGWEWFPAPAEDTLGLPDFSAYISIDDVCVVAVVVMGSGSYGLDGLQLSMPQAPAAALLADPESGPVPLTVNFDASGSDDPDGTIVDFEWDFDGNGLFNEEGNGEITFRGAAAAQCTYSDAGSFDATVRVTDDDGKTDTAVVPISVSNSPPVADLQADVTEGSVPLEVYFDASASFDPDGDIVDVQWDLDGDGTFDEPGAEADARGSFTPAGYTYGEKGVCDAQVQVTDDSDLTATASLEISTHSWVIVTVDAPPSTNVGNFANMALINGHPAIAYQDQTNHALKYAYSTTTLGSQVGDWVVIGVPTPGQDNPGGYSSLAEVNGAPAIVQYESVWGKLHFQAATTPTGADYEDWTIDATIEDAASSGYYANLIAVDGNPAVAYVNDNTHESIYCRSSSIAGDQDSDWSNKVVIDGGSDTYAMAPCLAIIDGNPAVVYHYEGSGEVFVRYCRSTTATGESVDDWTGKVDLYGPIGYGTQAFSLQMVDGKPALSFWAGGVEGGILYCLANDATGASWAEAVVVQSGVTSLYTSMAVVNGHPAIAYCDGDVGGSTGDLRYTRSTSATGALAADWQNDELLDGDTTEAGQYATMLIVDGSNPAIAYWDKTAGVLKYAVQL